MAFSHSNHIEVFSLAPDGGVALMVVECEMGGVLGILRRLRRGLLIMVWGVFGVVGTVNALETLPDPTRPPGVGTTPAFGEEASKAPPPVPVLQSIMLSSKRSAAIISGQTVVLGGRFGEYRLVKLSHSEAVLKGESDTQVLKLFPDVEKKMRTVSDETMQAKKSKVGNKPVKKDER